MTLKKVAVIGGGISGLSAALWLTKPTAFAGDRPQPSVTLFERSTRLGGVIETLRDGDCLVEKGADNFATLLPHALELTETFGDVNDLIAPVENDRRAFVVSGGQLQPIPVGFSLMQPTRLWPVLTTPTLSWSGRLRVLGEYFVKAKPSADSSQDESLESFAVRRLGREAFERLVEPIVGGIFTADPATLSMRATLPQFLQMEAKHGGLIRGHLASKRKDAVSAARKASGARYDQFRAPQAGMQSWIDRLAAALPEDSLQLNSRVQSIEKVGPLWQVAYRVGDGVSQRAEFDGLIIATPAKPTSQLLEEIDAELAKHLAAIQYASSAVVAMIVNKADVGGRIDGFGAIVPSREKRQALAISFTSNKYPGRVPDGKILVRIFFGGALKFDVLDKNDGQLRELALQELRDLLAYRGPEPEFSEVLRWPEAMPQYKVGHVDRVQEIRARLELHRGLQLCGAAYQGVGIPQCIRSGKEAAEATLHSFGS